MATREDYKVTISEASRDFTAKEKIALKDMSRAISLDASIVDENDRHLVIEPADYAVVDVHNEHSENVDYTVFCILDKNGDTYKTGSESFFNAFRDIYDTMKEDAPDEPYTITVYKQPSNKYKGKFMLLCSIN